MRLRPAVLLFPCLALLVGSPVNAETPSKSEATDELDLVKLLNVEVSTATKTSESLDDAPAVITVITRDDIQRWGYQSVAEVLQHTVGFYLVDDQIAPNAGVRGMTGGLGSESGTIKVMIDGRSVAYRTTSGNWLGIELIPLGSIEQIEVIRGPASALYGADAFLGVVNIITTKPEHLRPVRARIATGRSAGAQNTWGEVVSGTQVGNFDFMLGAAGEYGSNGYLTLPAESPGPTFAPGLGARRTAVDLDRRSLVLQTRIGYRPDAFDHLVFSAYGSGMERGGDFAQWAQLTNGNIYGGSPGGTTIGLQQLRLNVDGVKRLTDGLDLAAQSTYFQGGLLPQDRIEVGSDLFYIKRHQSYHGADSMLELRWLPSSRFNAIVGGEFLYDYETLPTATRVNRVTGAEFNAATSRSIDSIALTNLATYVSINYKLLDPWLKFTGGARIDHHSVYGTQTTGRAGITSRLSKAIVAKLLYGSAFKAPSPYLMYATPLRPGDVIGNPNLSPQHIHTVEFQISWKPDKFFGLTSGVSQNWLLDKAEFTPQGINLAARNVASQRSFTWETRADAKHYNDVAAYAAFELIRSWRDLGQEGYAANLVGTQNVVYPDWILRAGVSFAIPSTVDVPLQMSSQVMVVGPRRAADTTIVEVGHDVVYPTYTLLDISLSTREIYWIRGQESRFSLHGRNLLAARGPDPGFGGFEYPLRPTQVFLEFDHTY
jgi:iron complex outermembrane receptor protein